MRDRRPHRRGHRPYRPAKTCGKSVYPTRAEAERWRWKLGILHECTYRVYGCPDCGGFHLTTKRADR